MKGGHGILTGTMFIVPTKALKLDPCPLGLPETTTEAHVLS